MIFVLKIGQKLSILPMSISIETLGGVDALFDFWFSNNETSARKFVEQFIVAYNLIADKQGYDYMMGITE